jgi:hypothetical protein
MLRFLNLVYVTGTGTFSGHVAVLTGVTNLDEAYLFTNGYILYWQHKISVSA